MRDEVITALQANTKPPAYTIDGGSEQKKSGHHIGVTVPFKKIVDLALKDTLTGKTLANVSGGQLDYFFDFLDDRGKGAFTPATYREVKDNALWKAVYNVRPSMWTYTNKEGEERYVEEPSVTCRVCGLLLPLKVMTVDHSKPQTGGATLAICRVFRGLGLTKGRPKGPKNQAAVAQYAGAVGGVAADAGSWSLRYTLNDVGTIYYSVVKEGKKLDALGERCLNHMLNLRPVCGPCNSRLRNLNAF